MFHINEHIKYFSNQFLLNKLIFKKYIKEKKINIASNELIKILVLDEIITNLKKN